MSEDPQKQNTEKATPNTPKTTPLADFLKTNDILLMIYPKTKDGDFKHEISQEDERTVYKLMKGRGSKTSKNLLICLDTGGGNVYAAVKIMDILRDEYSHISIAVMEEAKSSGTMMCLAADSVIMSHVSELGPLDKPMLHPSDETSTISALDIAKSLDAIIDTAQDKQLKLASKLTKQYRLKRERALEIAGKSVSDLMSPLLSKQDVMIYNQALRLLRMSEVYGKRFLRKYALAWIANTKLRTRIADLVIEKLIWSYPDHNFAICRDDCEEELWLPIKNAEELPYWDELWKRFDSMIDSREKTIEYLKL